MLKSRIPLDDVQVKEALEQIQDDYKTIARLKTVEDRELQFMANSTIKFFEMRIEETEYALWKAGVQMYNAERHKARYEKLDQVNQMFTDSKKTDGQHVENRT